MEPVNGRSHPMSVSGLGREGEVHVASRPVLTGLSRSAVLRASH